jgi:hypothetical protein
MTSIGRRRRRRRTLMRWWRYPAMMQPSRRGCSGGSTKLVAAMVPTLGLAVPLALVMLSVSPLRASASSLASTTVAVLPLALVPVRRFPLLVAESPPL